MMNSSMLTPQSLAVCVECGCLVDRDHPCDAIPPTELDCLGRTVFYLLRGEMIARLARERK